MHLPNSWAVEVNVKSRSPAMVSGEPWEGWTAVRRERNSDIANYIAQLLNKL